MKIIYALFCFFAAIAATPSTAAAANHTIYSAVSPVFGEVAPVLEELELLDPELLDPELLESELLELLSATTITGDRLANFTVMVFASVSTLDGVRTSQPLPST